MEEYMKDELLKYTEKVGERISDWIDKSLTFKNGCKTVWQEGCGFESDEISWLFTCKGQRLYESYISKAKRLIEKKFPNEQYEDLESFTRVKYP